MFEKYVKISQEKLELVQPNYKVGNSWVSFYLRDIATIRNNDWENLQPYFNVPNPVRTIDFQKTTLKKSVIIPTDFEYHNEEENEITVEQTTEKIIPLFPETIQDYSKPKPKVAAYAAASMNHKVYQKET
jgi:hypothetical protein